MLLTKGSLRQSINRDLRKIIVITESGLVIALLHSKCRSNPNHFAFHEVSVNSYC